MKQIRSHKIRMYPSKTQEQLLVKGCGISRFVYNWGLEKWKQYYKAGKKVNSYLLKKEFNNIKREKYPFVMEVSKCISEYAFMNLNNAFQSFFNKQTGYPTFKRKKYGIGSFTVANDKFYITDKKIRLPKVGFIKLSEQLRFEGKLMKATVSTYAGEWFVSISVEVDNSVILKLNCCDENQIIGLDLGIKDFIILSNGIKINYPDLNKQKVRLIREQRRLSRKVKGSSNRKKQIIQLQKTYRDVNNKKIDFQFKVVDYLAKNYHNIYVEDLNIKGLMKNRKLSHKFQELSFSKFITTLSNRTIVYKRDRWFPSSKLCSTCGYKNTELKLSDRTWECKQCGILHDRDINAAINMIPIKIRQALAESTPVDNGTSGLTISVDNLSSLVEAGIKVTKNNINKNIHFSIF